MFDFFDSAVANWGTSHFTQLSLIVWILILLALAFDFLNGLHDAANSIATVVSTRVLSPQLAVIWAAFFNFVAFLIFPLKVATTIQGDIIDMSWFTEQSTNYLIAATLIAACGWNLLTWYLGLPTSSSHALIGGMVGSAVALTGQVGMLKAYGIGLICLFIVLAPLIGFILGSGIAIAVMWIFRYFTAAKVDRIFRGGQLVSAALFSLGHGGNDAQKTMGIIFVLLIASSNYGDNFPTPATVPTEVVLACHFAMGLGTLMGGWKIVKTMGQRISRLRPVDGFAAETGAALTLGLTTFIKGIPISTTHTITGAIVGVGSLKRWSAVRWGVAGRVVWAWVLTIPGSAMLAALSVFVMVMAIGFDAAERETRDMQGQYSLISLEVDGAEVPDGKADGPVLTIRGSRYIVEEGETKSSFKITLEPGKTPAEINMRYLDGSHKGKLQKGIYSFQDGVLKIARGTSPDQDRPRGFASAANVTVVTWKKKA